MEDRNKENYIIPEFGEKYMSTINREHVQKLYKHAVERSESVASLVKTVMNTSMKYALSKNVVAQNTAEGVNLPKCVKKKEYRIRKIDVKKTLTVEQVILLLEKSKETKIYLHILFAVMMGLRRSEINGVKYSDIDYLHRTLKVQRQLGKKPNTTKDDVAPKMLTKQDIPPKTDSSYRELDIPDIVFEAILEQRKIYEANRRRRPKEFRDLDYICCSSYGNPRSKSFHHQYYKELLQKLGLPDIRFHALRSTITTILMKNNFNLKGISKMLGHASEIISADVYGDTQEIIEDCLDVLEPFIMEVIPEEMDSRYYDYSDIGVMEEYYDELMVG
ncbi:MAG: site-specific integrase [Hespellia sp.]|nr:site-specific integrase [Hespellia sp.]